MRKLFSAGKPCKAGCQYCFAKWSEIDYKLPQVGMENERMNEKEAIIYPCCDGEFLDQSMLIENLEKTVKKMNKVYLSISTKHFISDDVLNQLSKLNHELKTSEKGFVKLAISLSNMSMIKDIESHTLSYVERLELAKAIKSKGIFLGLTIKPILPFISAEEYCNIIHDFSPYTKYVLIGGLYLNRNSVFYTQYIKGSNEIQHRTVKWLPEQPEWEYIEDSKQFQQIRKYAEKKGVLLFDSDVDLIKSYINQED